MNLANENIVLAKQETPAMTVEESDALLKHLPGWEWKTEQGMPRLIRTFKFRNFVNALEFTRQIGELAEEVNHHPALLTEWGKVTVSWWTHSIGGLHFNDFIMAARSDHVYSDFAAAGN